MTRLLVWTVLTVSVWTLGSCLVQEQEPVLYPKVGTSQTIRCNGACSSCVYVFWFRTLPSKNAVEYLGRYDDADTSKYGGEVDKRRFKFSKSGAFQLRIVNLTEADAGVYTCVLKGQSLVPWEPGVLLRPGETAPTMPPPIKPKPPHRPFCPCPKKKPTRGSCGSLVLWPLVGVLAGLSVALLSTLYYFSRLPKKCRHRLVKKR
ncbi:uncharacterized protein cd8b isoform X2 [Genypterus blacodes]|uniref:uncharacterized protein cd8b isoform X2 n=1 Tax=Genypterus blacodes TaxID=154954 RepID=UPI003F7701C5